MSENITTLENKRRSIEVGGTVTLKSGGPAMTVAERTADKVYCFWHCDDGELSHYWFPTVCVQVKP